VLGYTLIRIENFVICTISCKQPRRMRSTRVAAAIGEAAVAAGLGPPRNLQQTIQWLQHIKATAVIDLGDVWLRRAGSIHRSMKDWLKTHDAKGGLPAATEQQLLIAFQLLCESLLQLLRQAPGVAPKQQQLAGGTSTDQASSSSSQGTATDPVPAATALFGLLENLVGALTLCGVCLGSVMEGFIRIHVKTGGCLQACAAQRSVCLSSTARLCPDAAGVLEYALLLTVAFFWFSYSAFLYQAPLIVVAAA
jgi:hypothetical protein